MELDLQSLAEQMTLLESEGFISIHYNELLDHAWNTKRSGQVAPNVTQAISRFNQVWYSLLSMILTYYLL
jgi:hypothetical protein